MGCALILPDTESDMMEFIHYGIDHYGDGFLKALAQEVIRLMKGIPPPSNVKGGISIYGGTFQLRDMVAGDVTKRDENNQ